MECWRPWPGCFPGPLSQTLAPRSLTLSLSITVNLSVSLTLLACPPHLFPYRCQRYYIKIHESCWAKAIKTHLIISLSWAQLKPMFPGLEHHVAQVIEPTRQWKCCQPRRYNSSLIHFYAVTTTKGRSNGTHIGNLESHNSALKNLRKCHLH